MSIRTVVCTAVSCFALLLVSLGLALPVPAPPQSTVPGSSRRVAPPYASGRAIVKLVPGAFHAVAAHEVSVTGGLAETFRRARVRRASSLFPQLRTSAGARISAAARARAVQLRFPGRAARAPQGAPVPDLENLLLLDLDPGQSVPTALAELRRNPAVVYAEPDYLITTSLVPNDPYYASVGTWWPGPDMWAPNVIGLEAAWDVTTGSDSVTLAVVDTGLDADHPDLVGRVWTNGDEIPGNSLDDDANGFVDDIAGWDFAYDDTDPDDGNGHGTHVSGTIAAATNNSLGIAGINWLGKVMPVKSQDDSGVGSVSAAAQAMVYAADNGADVINLSVGGVGYSQVAEDAVSYVLTLGCVAVAAAGNETCDAAYYYPAGSPRAVCVAASTADDTRASFSNYGQIVDVSAPGQNILSLRPGTGYGLGSGTSMAAPHVTGVLGLLISAHPAWTVAQLVAQLDSTAADADAVNPGYEGLLGMGRLDAGAALTTTDPRRRAAVLTPLLDDSLGDADGLAEPGERLQMVTTVKHFAGDSPDVTLTLSTSDPYVTPINTTASVRALSGWQAASTAADPFTFDLSAEMPPLHQVLLNMHLAASGYENDREFRLPVLRYLSNWPRAAGGGFRQHPVLADVDLDGRPEVVVASDSLHVLKGDGSELPGWPVNPIAGEYLGNWATPCVGDLDGDGSPEVVYLLDVPWLGYAPQLYAWHADGSRVDGFPISWGSDTLVATYCLSEIDGTPALEILVMTGSGWQTRLRCYRSDGTELTPFVSTTAFWPVWSDYAGTGVGDVNGDTQPEVVALDHHLMTDIVSPNRVWAWRTDGTALPGFPVSMPAETEYWHDPTGPALGDVDGDGVLDLVVSAGRYTYAITGAGVILPGWPQYGASPSLADLDRDGRLEIIAAGPDAVRVYSASGALWWLGETDGDTLWNATVADLDGDGSLEVIARDGHNTVHCWRADGALYAEFPVTTANGPGAPEMEASVAIGDINGDGYTDLITSGGPLDSNLLAIAAPGEYRGYVAWAMQRANPRRDCCYAPPGLDAVAVASDLPDTLAWEQTYAASLTYRNQGSGPWAQADGYRLALLSGTDHWGFTSAPIDHDVPPGGSYTFDFAISAPPITTLRYPEAATQTTPAQLDRLPTGWGLARGSESLFAADIAHEIAVSRFPDIQPGTPGAWARFYIEECAGRLPLIVAGYPEGGYLPALPVSRDQMAVFIQRALDLPLPVPTGRFTDVPTNHWAATQIEALAEAAIVGGYEDGSYRPTQVVNRDAMAVFVARGLAGGDSFVPTGPPTATFSDVPAAHWAFRHVEYAVARQVVGGYPDGTYRPDTPVSRDQMAVFVYRGFLQPTGAAVVLAGPAITAAAPTGECGWPSAARGPASNPGYAYVTFDAVRLGPGLAFGGSWEVMFELRSAATPEVPATGPYTHTVPLASSALAEAKAAAMASGDPYYTVAWDLPAGLTAGDYLLVVSAEDTSGALREIARRPAFALQ